MTASGAAARAPPELRLRPERPENEPFLFRLFCEAQNPATSGFPADLLRLQFAGQRATYRARVPACRFAIAEQNGIPVGRIVTQMDAGTIRIVDLAIAAAHRNRGLGTRLVADVTATAYRQGWQVALSVLAGNVAARRFYGRLGFREVGSSPIDIAMTFTP